MNHAVMACPAYNVNCMLLQKIIKLQHAFHEKRQMMLVLRLPTTVKTLILI